MKIGIVTWFQGLNYGTNLQAVALQGYLRGQGHQVEIINRQAPRLPPPKRSLWSRLRNQPEKYASRYFSQKYAREIALQEEKIGRSLRENCVFTKAIRGEAELIRECNRFELLICGGDQIWNPNWYHRFYYADYPGIRARKISYAPSLGVERIPGDKLEQIGRSLQGFDFVSVREKSGAELLAGVSPVRPQVVVDPVLLPDAADWAAFADRGEAPRFGRYALSLFLTDNLMHWRAAESFAKKRGLVHVAAPCRGLSCLAGDRLALGLGLEDMLALIRGAEYVLTDSFHITTFSLLFHRPFFSFQRFREDAATSQNGRVVDLLETVGLRERCLPFGTGRIAGESEIDYRAVDARLAREIDSSKEYLRRAIGGKEHGMQRV